MNDHCKNSIQSFDALLGRVEVTIKDNYYYCLDGVSSQITDHRSEVSSQTTLAIVFLNEEIK